MYREEETGKEFNPRARKTLVWLVTAVALASGAFLGRDCVNGEVVRRFARFDARGIVRRLTA